MLMQKALMTGRNRLASVFDTRTDEISMPAI
jgi:hypothetical protein